MKKYQDLAVIDDSQKNAITQYTGSMFSDIDFEGLNKIIERISKNKEELTDNMRVQAIKFAEDWDNLVVARLDDKKDKLELLVDFFTNTKKEYNYIADYFSFDSSLYVNGHYIKNDGIIFVVENVLRSLGCYDYTHTLNKLNDEYEELTQNLTEKEPDKDEYFLNETKMSFHDRIVAEKKYELDMAKYDKEKSIAYFKFRKEFITFRKTLLKNKKVASFINTLNAQLRQAKNTRSIVHEKSSMVKMAINFGGTDLLKALQELHEFQKGL